MPLNELQEKNSNLDNVMEYTPNWFSNMLPMEQPLVYQGNRFRTVEHFFQAMKMLDHHERRMMCDEPSPYSAKKRSKYIKIRDDWDKIRLDVMEYALRHKFQKGTVYHKMLMDTGSHEITEWNYWGDTFWGKDIRTGKGENHLGKLLMKLRSEFEN